MLGKLFRYDFKEMGVFYLPLYLVYAGIAVIFTISIAVEENSTLLENSALFSLIFGVVAFVFGLSIFALLLLSGLIKVYYFYRKFVSEEAYLTMTLPVKTWRHVVGILLASAVWKLITILVFLISMGLILLATGVFDVMRDHMEIGIILRNLWIAFVHETGFDIVSVILGVIYIIFTFFTSPLIYFASLSLGQRAGKHKLLLSVVAFVGISIVVSIITGNSMTHFAVAGTLTTVIAAALLEDLILSGIYYMITWYSLEKNLNLE